MRAAARPSTERVGRGYRGVMRRGARVLWRCPHVHVNRDESSRSGGRSALHCAKMVVSFAATGNEFRQEYVRLERLSWRPDPDLEELMVLAPECEAASYPCGLCAGPNADGYGHLQHFDFSAPSGNFAGFWRSRAV